MGKTLTIVAQDPILTLGDTAIDDVWKKLEERQNEDDHEIARASTLNKVSKILMNRKHKHIDLLQIIGHGSPGRLWLSGERFERETEKERVFLLDSNPNYYRLLDGLIPNGCRVFLMGCNVGAESTSSRYADGPTLLFDLARMWGCKVGAPNHTVNATDIDEVSGIFREAADNDEQTGVNVAHAGGIGSGWKSNKPLVPIGIPARLEPIGTAGPNNITFHGFRGLPLIGVPNIEPLKPSLMEKLFGFNTVSKFPPHLTARVANLRDQVGREVDGSLLLASAELAVDVRIDGQSAIGEIICNNSILRVRTTPRPRFFELASTEVDDVVRQVIGWRMSSNL